MLTDDHISIAVTIECRAKLDGKQGFNILVASEIKASATHWELYTHANRGTLALYMPGRGGDYDSKVDVCDGKWHDFTASVDEKSVVMWVDGKQVFEKLFVARIPIPRRQRLGIGIPSYTKSPSAASSKVASAAMASSTTCAFHAVS